MGQDEKSELVKMVIKTMAEVEDERKKKRREETQRQRSEPRVKILKYNVPLYGSGKDMMAWLNEANDYITQAILADYKPPYEKRQQGILLELNSDYDWPRAEGSKLIITPDVKFEQSWHGRMNFQFFQSGGEARYIIANKKSYIALEKGSELSTLAVAGYVSMVHNNTAPLYNLLLDYISKYLVFRIGDIHLAGYDDIVSKCKLILEPRNRGLMNRHILLAGPPGCGKSMIAKKVVSEQNHYLLCTITRTNGWLDWIELLSEILKFCNREVLIMIDEIDELGLSRGSGNRQVYGLLKFLDGIADHKNVKIVATTNRPQDLDEALLRVGRFGPVIYVEKPNKEQKIEIFKYYLQTYNHNADIEYIIGNLSGELTGADIRAGIEDCIIYNQEMNTENILANLHSILETKQKLNSGFYLR